MVDKAVGPCPGLAPGSGVFSMSATTSSPDPKAATELSAALRDMPGLVYEAHSTDYQTRDALRALHAEMAAGLPLFGYLHWSLLDNYEWGSYTPTFGLIGWDPETFERTPKPSLAWLGEVARGVRSVL